MKLRNKHTRYAPPVQTVGFSDFSGGLNTSQVPELIKENELSAAVNVELYKGQLRVIAGTLPVVQAAEMELTDLIFDAVGMTLLVASQKTGKLYRVTAGALAEVGALNLDGSYITYTTWEDGVVIAAGGHLQYYHGGLLETIEESPANCRGVFVKEGRVWTFYGDELHASGIGDEHAWKNDSNNESSAQWLQVGYKDGGKIVGVTTLSADTIIFKDNLHAYHLSGSYPNWKVSEIGRQIECKCYHACAALVSSTVVLGRDMVQVINVTDEYGDMRATNISDKVYREVAGIGASVKLRYFPSLGQVWFIDGAQTFLFLDVAAAAYFRRAYHAPLVDAVEADGRIYLLKPHGLYVVDAKTSKDEGKYLAWRFALKTLVADNAFLIKRVRVDTTPFLENDTEETYMVGNVKLHGGHPSSAYALYHNDRYIYHNETEIYQVKYYPLYGGNPAFDGADYGKPGTEMYRAEVRCVDRQRAIVARAKGEGGITIFNSISFDVAEV